MTPDTDTTSPLLLCLDAISPVLFVAFCAAALIAGWILQRHNKLTLQQTYRAMTARLKVEKPFSFHIVIAVWVAGSFGYFVYANQTICSLPAG